jgi:hypothetical protein
MKTQRVAVRTWLVYGALFCLPLTGCGGGPDTPAPEALPPIPSLDRLYRDAVSGMRDSMRLVIRDQASLEDAWERATSEQLEMPAVPAVDFGREMVLVAAAGRMTTEDAIEVAAAGVQRRRTQEGDDVDVLVVQVRTLKGCGRVTADAFPVDIVKVTRFEGRVQWEEETQQETECGTLEPDGRAASDHAPGGMAQDESEARVRLRSRQPSPHVPSHP